LQSGKVGEKAENTGSDKGKLVPTDIGTMLRILVKNFGNILDYNFTAKVEQILMKLQKECVWTK
jgi:DNA topoisomerase-1